MEGDGGERERYLWYYTVTVGLWYDVTQLWEPAGYFVALENSGPLAWRQQDGSLSARPHWTARKRE